MGKFNHICRCLFITSVILSLMACAGRLPIHDSRSLSDYSEAPLNDGMLLVSTVVNSGEADQVSSILVMRADAVDRDEAKKKGLKRIAYKISNKIYNKSRDLSLLFGALPAGNYRIIQINNGNKYIRVATDHPWLGEFKVEAGKTSDLGMLIMTAANFNILIGRSRQFSQSNQLVQRFYDKHPTFEKTINGWINPVDSNDFSELFALKHVQGITGMAELPGGEMIAGSRLGSILVRRANGLWGVAARNHYFDAITYVATSKGVENTDFFAATDNGEVLSVKNGSVQQINLGDLPKGQVRFIDRDIISNQWFVAVKVEDDLNLYQSTQLENGNWKLIQSSDESNSMWSGKRNSWTLKTKNGLIFGGADKPILHCYNYSTKVWTTSNIPYERTLTDLKVNQITGKISILTSPGGGFGGAFAKSYIADNCGAEWQKIDPPYTVEVRAPIPLNNGDIIVIGGVFSDEGLYGSSDSGKTWDKLTNESVLSQKLYVTKQHGLFMVDIGKWGVESIQHSTDGGKTWKIEHSSIDYEMWEAEKRRNAKQKKAAAENKAG